MIRHWVKPICSAHCGESSTSGGGPLVRAHQSVDVFLWREWPSLFSLSRSLVLSFSRSLVLSVSLSCARSSSTSFSTLSLSISLLSHSLSLFLSLSALYLCPLRDSLRSLSGDLHLCPGPLVQPALLETHPKPLLYHNILWYTTL